MCTQIKKTYRYCIDSAIHNCYSSQAQSPVCIRTVVVDSQLCTLVVVVNHRKYRTSHTVAAVDLDHMFVDLKTTEHQFYTQCFNNSCYQKYTNFDED